MGLVADLVARPGVVAAGEYAYRGDRFSYRGELTEEWARMFSIMSRATTMSAVMQVNMAESLRPGVGLHPARGWVVRGAEHSVCVVANVFCLLDNREACLNEVLGLMRSRLDSASPELV